MEGRPPAFVRNNAGARHINTAHGLYPRQQMGAVVLDGLAQWLRSGGSLFQGRAHAGADWWSSSPRRWGASRSPAPRRSARGL